MFSIKQWLAEKGNQAVLVGAWLLGGTACFPWAWPVAWVGLIPIFWGITQSGNVWQAWERSLCFGVVYHALVFLWFWGLHPVTWIGMSPEISLLITALGWLVLCLTQGLIISLVGLIVYGVWHKHPALILIAAPVCWVSALWFLNQNPIGQAWGFLVYSQAAIPWVRQSTYGLTFWGVEALMVLVNASFFLTVTLKKRWTILPAMIGIMLVILFGNLVKPAPSNVLKRLNPVLIQGNIPLEMERLVLTETQKQQYYQTLIHGVPQTISQKSALIVLPEGVISIQPKQTHKPFTVPGKAALLTGAVFWQNPQVVYNGAILFAPDQEPQKLAKRYLVPFGETTPFISEDWLIEKLSRLGIRYGRGFAVGRTDQPMMDLNGYNLGVFVCFEALYPNLSWDYRSRNTDLLVTFSNLGWYHQSRMLQERFLAINQLRAAEAGVPLLLVTNTGISAIIASDGTILARSQTDEAGYVWPEGDFAVRHPILLHK